MSIANKQRETAKDCESAMKEAVKQSLHEVLKRKHKHHPMSRDYKSIDDIVLEIIKEIEKQD